MLHLVCVRFADRFRLCATQGVGHDDVRASGGGVLTVARAAADWLVRAQK
jgi:hypothetical protein